jgi:hypothetical protein
MLRWCFRFLFWLLAVLGSLWLVGISFAYFSNYDAAGFPHSRAFYTSHRLLVRTHIGFGLVTLLAGPFLFIPARSDRFRRFHRRLGAVYIGAICLIAAPTSIWLLPAIPGRFYSQLGLLGLSLAWLGATIMVLRRPAAPSHRQWAVRSYSLTLAAVTFRAIVGTLVACGITFDTAYAAAAWLWLFNPLMAEYYATVRGATVSPATDKATPTT